jgi:hypothetical protein
MISHFSQNTPNRVQKEVLGRTGVGIRSSFPVFVQPVYDGEGADNLSGVRAPYSRPEEYTMSLAEKMLRESWDHNADADRVEHVCAYNPDLAGRVGMIALRFIQEKGLSGEFADLLEEIDRKRMPDIDPEP